MITPVLCLVAENVVRDAESNTMSVINIVEEVVATGVPTLMPKIAFLAIWEREPEDPITHTADFQIKMGEQFLLQQEVTINFGRGVRTRNVINIIPLLVPALGEIEFTMSIRGGPRQSRSLKAVAPPNIAQVQNALM